MNWLKVKAGDIAKSLPKARLAQLLEAKERVFNENYRIIKDGGNWEFMGVRASDSSRRRYRWHWL